MGAARSAERRPGSTREGETATAQADAVRREALDDGPLRIAVFCWRFPTLSETFIVDQVMRIVERGHSVDLFAFQRGEDELLADVIGKSHGRLRTTTFDLPDGRTQRLVGGAKRLITGGPSASMLAMANSWAHGASATSMRLLHAAHVLRHLRPRYDVVHAHFGDIGAAVVALRDAGFIGGPIVTTFHGRDFTSYPRRHGARCYDALFAKGDAFTLNSRYTRDRVLALARRDDIAHATIPMGVRTDAIAFGERTAQPGASVRFLTIGRLVEKKGTADLLDAVALLRAEGMALSLDIVGDGPLRADLQAQAHASGIADVVTFHGAQPHGRVFELIDESDLFVLPSVTAADGDTEGQGVALIEAQAAGLPVIATRHAALPESLLEGRSGLLVDERAPSQLAEAMRELAAASERWGEMGRAGSQFVRARFDQSALADTLIAYFREVAAKRRLAAR